MCSLSKMWRELFSEGCPVRVGGLVNQSEAGDVVPDIL